MHRVRSVLLLFAFALALLIGTSLYLGQDYVSRINFPHPNLRVPSFSGDDNHDEVKTESTSAVLSSQTSSIATLPTTTDNDVSLSTPSPKIVSDGDILSAAEINTYISSILNPSLTVLPRLTCPPINTTRYAPLLTPSSSNSSSSSSEITYFFALNLRNNLPILPRLLSTIIQTITFLGPSRCALSIVEGNSPDGTSDILTSLTTFLSNLNITYHYNHSTINPSKGGNRISKLAQLRNLALDPLLTTPENISPATTTVLFINDVAACPEDLLELLLQRNILGADMTCGMDWTYVGPNPTFYDVWIARSITGHPFFHIPSSGSWDSAWDLLPNDQESQTKLRAKQPFQVYSCWNGAAVFTAAPLLGDNSNGDSSGGEGGESGGIKFRDAKKGHCKHGEPQNFCKDLWTAGYGKIAVIPTVNLEYSDEKAAMIKKEKGYVSDLVKRGRGDITEEIDWVGPPEEVWCMQGWKHQFWKPWKVSRRQLSS